MNFINITAILLSGASIALGAFFGALRSKIFATKTKNTLHYSFYILSIVVFLTAILSAIIFKNELFSFTSWYPITVFIISIVASVALFIITKKYLTVKDIYNISELNPIVNDFTSDGDRNQIKLFGGDFSFLGNTTVEISSNSQYIHLRSLQFTSVLILCETPKTQAQKRRYGQMLTELPGVLLKFYNPEKADLKVRGRIIQVNGVNKLLMYTKVKSEHYQAIHTDTANSNGALYNNIWDLVWDMANTPSEEDINYFKNCFTQG